MNEKWLVMDKDAHWYYRAELYARFLYSLMAKLDGASDPKWYCRNHFMIDAMHEDGFLNDDEEWTGIKE